MLSELSHFVWLVGVGAAAIIVLRPASTASPALRRFAIAALAALVADGVAWPLGIGWLRPLTALVGGALVVAAVLEVTRTSSIDAPEDGEGDGDGPRSSGTGPSNTRPADAIPRRLAVALDRWSEPAAMATGDGTLEWANAAWKKEHGVADSSGTTWADYRAQSEASGWQILLAKAADRGDAEGFLRHRGAAGTWASRSHAVAVEGAGERRIFVTSVRQSDAEAQLRRQAREVGHNLNNVLSAVVGNVGLAIETPGIDPDLQADLREAETGALRAAELIHQLQALARGES
ncbi:MAG: hypothetical protein AAGF23_18240 [Acidobacteriota bacterium]